jgi:hypothetical protein
LPTWRLSRAFFRSTLAEVLGDLPADERAALRRALEAARVALPEDPSLVALLAIVGIPSVPVRGAGARMCFELCEEGCRS